MDAALALTPVVVAEAPAPTPAAAGFAAIMTCWIGEPSRRPRAGAGKPLSKLALAGLVAMQARFTQYAQVRGTALHPESLDLTFY
ncbi:hypothetical protein GCM10027422_38490 [Hymenobacter arcticus]